MPKNAFNATVPGYSAPASGAATVTPNDAADLAVAPCRSLFVGTGGTIVVDTVDGDTSVPLLVPTGFILPLFVTRVRNTGTTADDIVALY